MKKLTAIILSLVLNPCGALADGLNEGQFLTNGQLKEYCEDLQHTLQQPRGPHTESEATGAGVCFGFFTGLPSLCVPDGVTLQQKALVFVKWANDHPEKLHEPALAGGMIAIIEAFPSCQGPKK
jgi:hypothetical protein